MTDKELLQRAQWRESRMTFFKVSVDGVRYFSGPDFYSALKSYERWLEVKPNSNIEMSEIKILKQSPSLLAEIEELNSVFESAKNEEDPWLDPHKARANIEDDFKEIEILYGEGETAPATIEFLYESPVIVFENSEWHAWDTDGWMYRFKT